MGNPCDEDIEDPGTQSNNFALVRNAKAALLSGERGHQDFPKAIEAVIRSEAWRSYYTNGRVIRYDHGQFRKFVEAEYPEGLGYPLAEARRFLGDSTNPIRLAFESAIARGRGGNNNPFGRKGKPEDVTDHDNSMEDSTIGSNHSMTVSLNGVPIAAVEGQGDSVGYAIRRLGRERPDMLEKVRSGEIKSAHRAMIEAGLKPESFTVTTDPKVIARRVRKRLSPEQLADLVAELTADPDGVPTVESLEIEEYEPPRPDRIGLLANHYNHCASLVQCLRSLQTNKRLVPSLMLTAIQEHAWRDRVWGGGMIQFNADQFREYIEGPYPDSLNTPIDEMRSYLGPPSNPARAAFEHALKMGEKLGIDPDGE